MVVPEVRCRRMLVKMYGASLIYGMFQSSNRPAWRLEEIMQFRVLQTSQQCVAEVVSLPDKDTDAALTHLSSLSLYMYISKHHFVFLNHTTLRFKPFSWVNVVQVSPHLVTYSFLNLKLIQITSHRDSTYRHWFKIMPCALPMHYIQCQQIVFLIAV